DVVHAERRGDVALRDRLVLSETDAKAERRLQLAPAVLLQLVVELEAENIAVPGERPVVVAHVHRDDAVRGVVVDRHDTPPVGCPDVFLYYVAFYVNTRVDRSLSPSLGGAGSRPARRARRRAVRRASTPARS